jgi:hypothetical protein
MPLVTNRCKKHKNAHPENECPFCAQEEYNKRIEESRAFFEECGQYKIEIVPGRIVRVEDFYHHFRARLIEELSPTLAKVKGGHEP